MFLLPWTRSETRARPRRRRGLLAREKTPLSLCLAAFFERENIGDAYYLELRGPVVTDLLFHRSSSPSLGRILGPEKPRLCSTRVEEEERWAGGNSVKPRVVEKVGLLLRLSLSFSEDDWRGEVARKSEREIWKRDITLAKVGHRTRGGGKRKRRGYASVDIQWERESERG